MSTSKLSPLIVTLLFIAVIVCAAFILRVVLPYAYVFQGEWIKYTGTDAYYHMRIIDTIVHNFPDVGNFNPYLIFPGGGEITGLIFFDLFLSGIIWLIGMGSPSQHTIDIVSVHFPAVIGALTVIPVYFIGRTLCNRWCGMIAASLIAFIPGEFLGRSILGFTDNHVFEVFCSTLAVMFVILAVRSAREKELTFQNVIHPNIHALLKPLVYSVIAGVILALYLNSWIGSLLFIFILFLFVVVQYLIDYARGEKSDYLCITSTIFFAVTLIITLLLSHTGEQTASLVIATTVSLVTGIISCVYRNNSIKTGLFFGTLGGAGIIALAAFYLAKPGLMSSMISMFSVLNPSGGMRTISETAPILFPNGSFTFDVVWFNFTTGSILSLVALVIAVWVMIKKGEQDKTLLVVWSIILLLMTLSMRRWAYYFAVNVALLTAYVSWLALQRYFGYIEQNARISDEKAVSHTKQKHRKQMPASQQPGSLSGVKAAGIIIIVLIVILPNIIYARDTAAQPRFAPTNAWCESLEWLKENTPEPFGSSDFYNKTVNAPFTYPNSAYGVTAWWDYGYWITRIGHRVPNSNPGQTGAGAVARMFTAQNEDAALKSADALKSKYVIIDYLTTTSKFYAVAVWADTVKEEYYEVYYQNQSGKLTQVLAFYPEYYRSMAVRLYNFDGRKTAAQDVTVISYEEKTSQAGAQPYKLITGVKKFPSYEEAEVYVQNQKTGNYRLAGTNPFISPVPLEELTQYKKVYGSSVIITNPYSVKLPEVKIFERISQ